MRCERVAEALLDRSLGLLSREDAERLDAHLRDCVRCRSVAASDAAIDRSLASLAVARLPEIDVAARVGLAVRALGVPGARRRPLRLVLAAAFASLVAVLVGAAAAVAAMPHLVAAWRGAGGLAAAAPGLLHAVLRPLAALGEAALGTLRALAQACLPVLEIAARYQSVAAAAAAVAVVATFLATLAMLGRELRAGVPSTVERRR